MSRMASRLRTLKRARRVQSAFWTNAISSIGNLAISIAIARTASLDALGQFAVAFSIYALVTGFIRSSVSESVLTHSAWRDRVALAGRRVMALALVVATIVVIVSAVFDLKYLAVVGLALPGLALYDHQKTLNLAVDRENLALASEGLWCASALGALACSTLLDLPALGAFSLWAVTGALIGIVQALCLGLKFSPWWNDSRADTRVAALFGADYLAGSGVAQSTTSILALVAGSEVVGSLRGAATLMGPIGLVSATARSLLIPHMLRSINQPTNVQRKAAGRLSIALVMLVAPFAAVVALCPDALGELLLGANWEFASPLLPALAVELCFAVAATVPFAGHRVERAGARTLSIRLGTAPLRLGGVVLGAQIGGAQGAAIAMACLAALACAVWWASYWRLTSHRETEVK